MGFSLGKKKKGKFQVNLKDSVNLQWKLLFGRGGECQDLGTMKKCSRNLYSTQYEKKSNYSIIYWTELSCKKVIRHY